MCTPHCGLAWTTSPPALSPPAHVPPHNVSDILLRCVGRTTILQPTVRPLKQHGSKYTDLVRQHFAKRGSTLPSQAALYAKGSLANQRYYAGEMNNHKRSGDAQKVVALFEEMCNQDIAPTVIHYTTLITALSRARRVDEAFQYFSNMEVAPDVVLCNALISACASAGNAKKALEVLGDMEGFGVRPNVISYNSALTACAKNCSSPGGGRWCLKALEVFEAMRQLLQGENVCQGGLHESWGGGELG